MKRFYVLFVMFSLVLCVSCKQEVAPVIIKFGTALSAPHGPSSFGVTSIVLLNDTIIKANIEEYSYFSGETAVSVPNSNFFMKESGEVLGTKKANSTAYSQIMKGRGATKEYADNIKTIEGMVIGKTVNDLESLIAGKSDEEITDAVSGATLVHTGNYIKGVIDAAKNAK